MSKTEMRPARDKNHCWKCQSAPLGADLFCKTCHCIQPVNPNMDPFTRFGLHPAFEIDEDQVKTVHLQCMRKIHPDRFVTASPAEKTYAQEQAAALNAAMETLTDPLRRAEELLRLNGFLSDTNDQTAVSDPVFLMEMMDLQEELKNINDTHALVEMEACIKALWENAITNFKVLWPPQEIQPADPSLCQALEKLRYARKLELELRQLRARLRAQSPPAAE